MTFTLDKPYRCRNGAEAGAIKGPDGRLYGWVRAQNEMTQIASWDEDGKATGGGRFSVFDLINIPQRHTLDVYDGAEDGGPVPVAWASREAADLNSAPEHRIACLHIVRDFEDGEGL